MEEATEITLIYVPCGSEDEAVAMARVLLNERLVACGNIYQSRSLYRWEGDLVDESEHVLLCKTSQEMAPRAALRIRELHSYDVPCILQMQPARANQEYARWVHSQVGPAAGHLEEEARATSGSQG